jgi:hypothetical protein
MAFSGDVIAPGGPAGALVADPKVKLILDRFGKAVQRRKNWEDLWQDCYDFALPQREGFHTATDGENRMDRIFDETAIVGTQEFASRLQSGVCPSFSHWVKFECGPNVPKDQVENVNK